VKRPTLKQLFILCGVGLIPVVWAALLAAPALGGGLPEILERLTSAMNNPFKITLCGDSFRAVLLFVAAYGMGIGIAFATRKNKRPREEHGSAKWGNAGAVNRKYRDSNPGQNKILTQNVKIGFNGKKHRRNLNVLICGGSGAGKTRFYAKPNVMQCNSSMVVLDPKGLLC
jgi:type IV secretion system protein VirD4